MDQIPDYLLSHSPNYDDPRLDSVPFPALVAPLVTPWVPLPPRQSLPPEEAPTCPSAREMYLPAGGQRLDRWLEGQHLDLLDIKAQLERGIPIAEVQRPNRPKPIAIGQSEMQPWARGVVWDCRSSCCVPLDFQAAIQSDLNLDFLRAHLGRYPDQTLLSYLLEGVRLEADVELQTVLVPHLTSLPGGMASVGKELRRLRDLRWYSFLDSQPFVPCYFNGQGAVVRILEPGRYRRTTEGGGPRSLTLDASGLPAISLNAASHIQHIPQHFIYDFRPQFEAWIRERGMEDALQAARARGGRAAPTPPDAELGQEPHRASKWPRERKPTVEMMMLALAVLGRAAFLLGEPLYIFGDDAKDFFNQLAMAESELWKLNVVFVTAPGDLEGASADELLFISERRLGFGTHGASNTAQRFSDALLEMFRDAMDEAEAAALAGPHSAQWDEWLVLRAGVAAEGEADVLRTRRWQTPGTSGEGADAAGVEVRPQQRLYFCLMYTDDPVCAVVGAHRALRSLRAWRQLTDSIELIMAIPEKRSLGSWAKWLGVLLIASCGLVVIPKDKLLRAATAISTVISQGCEFHEYRSLCGLLEHFRGVNLRGRNVMHGLYHPHRTVGQGGPNMWVACTELMRRQLERWLQLIRSCAGSSVKAAVGREYLEPQGGLTRIVADTDACHGDEPVSGLGGTCHGLYWYLPVRPEDEGTVYTAFLELLGVVVLVLMLDALLPTEVIRGVVLLIRTDALTAALTLPAESLRSPPMVALFMWMLGTAAWRRISPHLQIQHLYGDANPLADAVSRAKWQEFAQFCAQLGIRATHCALVPEAIAVYEHGVAAIREHRAASPAGGLSLLVGRSPGPPPPAAYEKVHAPRPRSALRLGPNLGRKRRRVSFHGTVATLAVDGTTGERVISGPAAEHPARQGTPGPDPSAAPQVIDLALYRGGAGGASEPDACSDLDGLGLDFEELFDASDASEPDIPAASEPDSPDSRANPPGGAGEPRERPRPVTPVLPPSAWQQTVLAADPWRQTMLLRVADLIARRQVRWRYSRRRILKGWLRSFNCPGLAAAMPPHALLMCRPTHANRVGIAGRADVEHPGGYFTVPANYMIAANVPRWQMRFFGVLVSAVNYVANGYLRWCVERGYDFDEAANVLQWYARAQAARRRAQRVIALSCIAALPGATTSPGSGEGGSSLTMGHECDATETEISAGDTASECELGHRQILRTMCGQGGASALVCRGYWRPKCILIGAEGRDCCAAGRCHADDSHDQPCHCRPADAPPFRDTVLGRSLATIGSDASCSEDASAEPPASPSECEGSACGSEWVCGQPTPGSAALVAVDEQHFTEWFDRVRAEDGLGLADSGPARSERRLHSCTGQKALEEYAKRGGEVQWFLLQDGDAPALAGAAARICSRRRSKELILEVMYVAKPFRRLGIAIRLASHLLSFRPTTVCLGVGLRANESMAEVFTRMGFARSREFGDWSPIQAEELAAALAVTRGQPAGGSPTAVAEDQAPEAADFAMSEASPRGLRRPMSEPASLLPAVISETASSEAPLVTLPADGRAGQSGPSLPAPHATASRPYRIKRVSRAPEDAELSRAAEAAPARARKSPRVSGRCISVGETDAPGIAYQLTGERIKDAGLCFPAAMFAALEHLDLTKARIEVDEMRKLLRTVGVSKSWVDGEEQMLIANKLRCGYILIEHGNQRAVLHHPLGRTMESTTRYALLLRINRGHCEPVETGGATGRCQLLSLADALQFLLNHGIEVRDSIGLVIGGLVSLAAAAGVQLSRGRPAGATGNPRPHMELAGLASVPSLPRPPSESTNALVGALDGTATAALEAAPDSPPDPMAELSAVQDELAANTPHAESFTEQLLQAGLSPTSSEDSHWRSARAAGATRPEQTQLATAAAGVAVADDGVLSWESRPPAVKPVRPAVNPLSACAFPPDAVYVECAACGHVAHTVTPRDDDSGDVRMVGDYLKPFAMACPDCDAVTRVPQGVIEVTPAPPLPSAPHLDIMHVGARGFLAWYQEVRAIDREAASTAARELAYSEVTNLGLKAMLEHDRPDLAPGEVPPAGHAGCWLLLRDGGEAAAGAAARVIHGCRGNGEAAICLETLYVARSRRDEPLWLPLLHELARQHSRGTLTITKDLSRHPEWQGVWRQLGLRPGRLADLARLRCALDDSLYHTTPSSAESTWGLAERQGGDRAATTVPWELAAVTDDAAGALLVLARPNRSRNPPREFVRELVASGDLDDRHLARTLARFLGGTQRLEAGSVAAVRAAVRYWRCRSLGTYFTQEMACAEEGAGRSCFHKYLKGLQRLEGAKRPAAGAGSASGTRAQRADPATQPSAGEAPRVFASWRSGAAEPLDIGGRQGAAPTPTTGLPSVMRRRAQEAHAARAPHGAVPTCSSSGTSGRDPLARFASGTTLRGAPSDRPATSERSLLRERAADLRANAPSPSPPPRPFPTSAETEVLRDAARHSPAPAGALHQRAGAAAKERLGAPPGKRRLVGALVFPPAPPKVRDKSKLATAARSMARDKVRSFREGEDAMAFHLSDQRLAEIADAMDEGIQFGVNSNTWAFDERAWDFWEHVCEAHNTSPLRTATEALQHPERNAHLLAALMMHASAVCIPRIKGRYAIKPKSALAYPLAIVRIFGRWGIPMPSYKLLKAALAYLSRLYVTYHGPYSLMAKRAEPMKFSMVLAIDAVAQGTRIGSIIWGDENHDVFMLRRLNCVMWPTAFRLGEIVQHSSGEVTYLTFESLTWSIAGVAVARPTRGALLAMRPGRDFARLAPPRAKADQWGEIHCPHPITLTFHREAGNAASALRDLELRKCDEPFDRAELALFHDAQGRTYSHDKLGRLLRLILTHLYGENVAKIFTFHSYRSGLATALHAAGVEPEVIMLVCRWMCAESLMVYRRRGSAEHELLTRKAQRVNVDAVQTANVVDVVGDQRYAELVEHPDGARGAACQKEYETALREAIDAGAEGRTCPEPKRAARAAASRTPRDEEQPPPRDRVPAPCDDAALSASVGDHIVVRREAWPSYACHELGGAGWRAEVISLTKFTAGVRFTAPRADGRAYETMRVARSFLATAQVGTCP